MKLFRGTVDASQSSVQSTGTRFPQKVYFDKYPPADIIYCDAATALVREMLHPNPKARPSWRDVMQNGWFKRLTEKEDYVVMCPDYLDSSCCFEFGEEKEAEEEYSYTFSASNS